MEIESCGSRIPRVRCHRDFPPGCGIVSNSSLKGGSGLKSVHDYRRDFPPGCGPNGPETARVSPVKRLGSGRDSGSCSDSTNWRRPVTATKSKPPLGGKMVMKIPHKVKEKEPQMGGKLVIRIPNKMSGNLEMKTPQKVKGKEAIGSGSGQREKVLEMLRLFRERCEKISTSGEGIRRVDFKANADLQEEGKIMYLPALMIGAVPGVEVGDKFYYRIELKIVGLHRLLQAGIDYMDSGRGKLATCIVANERHLDKMNDPNVLTYVGEGGSLPRHEVGMPPDQLLKAGNLALWNSKKEKKPVRVVRGLSLDGGRSQGIVYVYDGLYEVKDCEKKKGPQGNMIFEFQLMRCPGQPAVPWKTCRWARF